MDLLTALILGVVEGLTEFLPVSSTGHLIVAGHLLGFTGELASTFEVVIQLGAILAVVWEFRPTLLSLAQRARSDAGARRFILYLGMAFFPAAFFGLLLGSRIKALLFGPLPVAIALVVGGVVMYLLERILPHAEETPVTEIRWTQALGIGCAQVLALIPGVSRSASTILGGMGVGLSRATATEFSFFLALPTLGAATVYDLLKHRHLFTDELVTPLLVGMATSFVTALLVIRVFLKFVRTHDFRPFALYRILLGGVIWWLLG